MIDLKTFKTKCVESCKSISCGLLFLARHVFLTCLFILIINLIIGGIVFYRYTTLAKKADFEMSSPFKLKEVTLDNIINIWSNNEERFKETDYKEYPDPFKIEVKEVLED